MATIELSTLGEPIKTAYEGQPNTNAFTDAEKTKLEGIDPEATKNATDDQLRDRAQHTGVQPASSISDLPDLLAVKVNAEPGKGLSQENFTTELRNKLELHEDPNFKGVFLGLAALQMAFPDGAPGQYATVDDGEVVQWYAWDSTAEAWEPRVGESTELTPQQVGQYYESLDDRNAFRDADKAALDDLKQRAGWRRRGTWNAATNSPELLDGEGRDFDFYVVTTPGERSFGSFSYNFRQYDWVVYQGGTWTRLPTQDLTLVDIGAQPKQRGMYGPAIPALNRFLLSSSHTGTSELRLSTWGTVFGYDQFGQLAANGTITMPSWAKLARISAHIIPVQSGVGLEVEIRRGSRYGKGDHNTPAVTPIMKVSSTDVFEIIVRITSGAAVSFNTASWLCIELYE